MFFLQLVDDGITEVHRQRFKDLREVLDIHFTGRGNQLLLGHFPDDAGARLLAHKAEHLAVDFSVDQFPDALAFFRRQRLEDVGKVGGMQLIERHTQLAQVPQLQVQQDELDQITAD